MTFTGILILNVVLDVAILSALAFVMSRAGKLTRHAHPHAEHHALPLEASRARKLRRRAALRLRPLLG